MLSAYTLYKAEFIFLSYISPCTAKDVIQHHHRLILSFFQKVLRVNVFFTLGIYNTLEN